MDVIGMSKNGIENVVANLGTALTERQVYLLNQYSYYLLFVHLLPMIIFLAYLFLKDLVLVFWNGSELGCLSYLSETFP